MILGPVIFLLTKIWTRGERPDILPNMFTNEDHLIDAAIKNDPIAWDYLLTQYGGKMYGTALRLLKNEKDAEDAVQEVWIMVSQKLSAFRRDSKFATWLYRIMTNRCLEKIRSSKKARESTDSIDALMPDFNEDGHYKKQFTDWSHQPDRVTDQKILAREIQAALNSLPEEYRQVIVLRDVEGFSGDEVAQMLGLNESTMKTKLHRGRMALREKLERKYGKKPWYSFLSLRSLL